MKKKPHITRCEGWWLTKLGDEIIFADVERQQAYVSAAIVWRHQ